MGRVVLMKQPTKKQSTFVVFCEMLDAAQERFLCLLELICASVMLVCLVGLGVDGGKIRRLDRLVIRSLWTIQSQRSLAQQT